MDTLSPRTLPAHILRDVQFFIAESLACVGITEDEADEKLGRPIAALIIGEVADRYCAIMGPSDTDEVRAKLTACRRTVALVGYGDRTEEVETAVTLAWLNSRRLHDRTISREILGFDRLIAECGY